jgi:Na+/phosphate symporter
MKQRSTTGFHWTITNAMNAPLSYPIFSFIVGMLIPHLTITSLISGVFAASVLYVAGYALAGGSIGCAVVNHALGLPYEQYKTMMLFSCGILLLLSKLQAHLAQKGKE